MMNNNSRNIEHDLIAAAIIKLKKSGSDPLMIRCALAVNLVNLCDATNTSSPAVVTACRAVVAADRSIEDVKQGRRRKTNDRVRH